METRRWTNPSQPQTLQIAVFLLYFEAVFGLLFGGFLNPIGLMIIIGAAAGGFGIANEQKWGYIVGVVVAVVALLGPVLALLSNGPTFAVLFNLIFPVALVALLLHPQSRDYQRIWFR